MEPMRVPPGVRNAEQQIVSLLFKYPITSLIGNGRWHIQL